MSMFCYQCQETSRNLGCTMRGVCGKPDTLSGMMDLLIYSLRGLGWVSTRLHTEGIYHPEDSIFSMQGLFRTITNANFDEAVFVALVTEAISLRDKRMVELEAKYTALGKKLTDVPEAANFAVTPAQYADFSASVGVLRTENEDVRSLRETITYGLKGISAYGDHAAMLGYQDEDINKYIMEICRCYIPIPRCRVSDHRSLP